VRHCFFLIFFVHILGLTSLVAAQDPAAAKTEKSIVAGNDPADARLLEMFEAKIKTEWDAIKNKDKKAYGDLLADDYEGVEVDGQGERAKMQAQIELMDSNVANYTLWGFKLIPVNPDAALVIYESTIQFPPKSVVRFSRVYISELWMKRGGDWKEVHYQETHVK
jgi:hypothetical protein